MPGHRKFGTLYCATCGEPFGVDNNSIAAITSGGGYIYCPNGHKGEIGLTHSVNIVDQLKAQLAESESARLRLQDERSRLVGQVNAATSEIEKLKHALVQQIGELTRYHELVRQYEKKIGYLACPTSKIRGIEADITRLTTERDAALKKICEWERWTHEHGQHDKREISRLNKSWTTTKANLRKARSDLENLRERYGRRILYLMAVRRVQEACSRIVPADADELLPSHPPELDRDPRLPISTG